MLAFFVSTVFIVLLTSQILINEEVQKLYLNPHSNLDASDTRKLSLNIGSLMESIVLANNKSVSSIGIIGINSSIFTNTTFKVKTISDIKDTKLYLEAERGDRKPVWIGDPSELTKLYNSSKDKKKISLTCIRVLKEEVNGSIAGVLVIELQPEVIQSVLSSIKLGEGSEEHFVSTDGFDQRFAIQADDTALAADGYSFLTNELFNQIISSSESNASKSIKYNNKDFLMVFCKPEGTDFILASLLPFSTLLAGAARILTMTLILTCFAVICSIADGVKEMEECKDNVLASIENISAVSQQTAATTEEVSASTEQQMNEMQALFNDAKTLQKEATKLKESLMKFKI